MIDPKIVQSLFNKALALYDLGENDEALICIEKALTIDPQLIIYWMRNHCCKGEFFMARPIFPN
ncbi:MAG: tetratricopeptide repeat protein [Nitrososphaerota archaeon]